MNYEYIQQVQDRFLLLEIGDAKQWHACIVYASANVSTFDEEDNKRFVSTMTTWFRFPVQHSMVLPLLQSMLDIFVGIQAKQMRLNFAFSFLNINSNYLFFVVLKKYIHLFSYLKLSSIYIERNNEISFFGQTQHFFMHNVCWSHFNLLNRRILSCIWLCLLLWFGRSFVGGLKRM